jgi:hypothetical protein
MFVSTIDVRGAAVKVEATTVEPGAGSLRLHGVAGQRGSALLSKGASCGEHSSRLFLRLAYS